MTDPLDFTGKRVLVIGGSGGIGNGIAQGFRVRGAQVIVTGTRPDSGDSIAYGGVQMLLIRCLLLFSFALTTACEEPKGTRYPPNRQKLLVTDQDYLTNKECWGGKGLQTKGVWIPVEFAVDETENFTKVGISSRNCELMSVVDFEREARQVPKYYPFERHADHFEFVFSDDLRDRDGLLRKSKLLTSLSTVNVKYSQAVVFFDGHIKLGPNVNLPGGGNTAFNVTEVRR